MARIIFPHDNIGEAKAYIKALTGLTDVNIPNAPNSNDIGQILKVEAKFVSVESSVDIGFGYGAATGNSDVKVLLQDYWFLKETPGTIPEINSWTFAVGFRVGIKITGFKSDLNVGLGTLAAKAQMEGLNIQIQILRVGMPLGPNVPVNLAVPVTLDVEKFGDLKVWEGEVLSYVQSKRSELAPVLVSASININGEKLLNEAPGVRYSLWRISKGMKLIEALALLNAGRAPEVDQSSVRAVYSTVFNDPSMIIPGHASEKRAPGNIEKNKADNWLTGYKNI
jgi:hypothetical protein